MRKVPTHQLCLFQNSALSYNVHVLISSVNALRQPTSILGKLEGN